MTYKNLRNKMIAATIIAIFLVYIGYFFFATLKYQFQPLGISAKHRRYAFSTNKRVHLFLKKVYMPMCALFKNHYHFLTEEEFEEMERYVKIFEAERSRGGSL